MGADLMTIWLGQDGFDYNFQLDYAQVWDWEIDGIREVAEHDPDCLISIEYKPDEPRAHSLLRDAATTLLAIAGGRRAEPRRHASTSPMSSMPASSRPSRPISSIAAAGFSACISTTATPSATTG